MHVPSLDISIFGSPSQCYPDGCVADAIELEICRTLPVIAGLVPGLTKEQRLAVLEDAVCKERAAFVEMYGAPFGCEVSSHAMDVASAVDECSVALA